MTAKITLVLLALVLVALPLAACQQTDTDSSSSATETGDGTACLFAGTGATFAANDKRVNFTCGTNEAGEDVVLAGDIEVTDEGWMIDEATVTRTDDGLFKTMSSTMVPVDGITLVDGTACLFAGTGATFGVDGERVNYTCGANEAGEDVVLAGDIEVTDEGWTIMKGTVVEADDGFETTSSEMAVIGGLTVPAEE